MGRGNPFAVRPPPATACSPSGRVPARTATQAAKTPFFGVKSAYRQDLDPWQTPEVRYGWRPHCVGGTHDAHTGARKAEGCGGDGRPTCAAVPCIPIRLRLRPRTWARAVKGSCVRAWRGLPRA